MIDIKTAVEAACSFADVLQIGTDGTPPRVEEVTFHSEEAEWHITLGWTETEHRITKGGGAFGIASNSIEALPRFYKTFSINSNDGRVKSMQIRD